MLSIVLPLRMFCDLAKFFNRFVFFFLFWTWYLFICWPWHREIFLDSPDGTNVTTGVLKYRSQRRECTKVVPGEIQPAVCVCECDVELSANTFLLLAQILTRSDRWIFYFSLYIYKMQNFCHHQGSESRTNLFLDFLLTEEQQAWSSMHGAAHGLGGEGVLSIPL